MCDISKLKLKLQKCDNQDVEVLIVVKGETLSICHKCWEKLSKMDVNWGEEGITKGVLDEEPTEEHKPILGDDDNDT